MRRSALGRVRLTARIPVVGGGALSGRLRAGRRRRARFSATRQPPGTRGPIEAVPETWTWVPVEGAVCADGSATGIGVNLPARSRRVAVFLMAGGACGDEATCYRDRTATNIAGGYGAARFAGDIGGFAAAVFFDRSDGQNAFRDWRFVFVPYCTGDGHVGDDVAPYHWGRVQDAFGPVRVDLIDDSGPPLPPPYAGDQLLRTWFDAWQPAFPPDCPACPRRLPRLHRRRHHRLVLRHPGRRRRARARRPRRRHVRGVVLRDWLAQMEADDPAWASVEP